MTEVNILEFIYEVDSEAKAKEIWAAIDQKSEEAEHVSASGDWEFMSIWKMFHWGGLRETQIRPFERADLPERWGVPDLPHVEAQYSLNSFQDAIASRSDQSLEELTSDLIDFVTFVYSAGTDRPRVVYGVTDLHEELLAGSEMPLPVTGESLAENRIEYATWLMVFPPAMVETYGRETLLSAPAWYTDELDDGAIIVVSHPNPTGDGETKAIDEHLGLERPPEADEHTY